VKRTRSMREPFWSVGARRCSLILQLRRSPDENAGPGGHGDETQWGRVGQQTSSRVCRQRPREAEFMTIWIGQVEGALAPLGIARGRRWRKPGGTRALIEVIHIGHIEDDASPPGPLSVCRLGDQVEIARSVARVMALSPSIIADR
jgi:hypothetical protein